MKDLYTKEFFTAGKFVRDVPVEMIKRLNSEMKVTTEVDVTIGADVDSYINSYGIVPVKVNGCSNKHSKNGYYYIDLVNFLTWLNFGKVPVINSTKHKKYVYEIIYIEERYHNIIKYVESDYFYEVDAIVVVSSKSSVSGEALAHVLSRHKYEVFEELNPKSKILNRDILREFVGVPVSIGEDILKPKTDLYKLKEEVETKPDDDVDSKIESKDCCCEVTEYIEPERYHQLEDDYERLKNLVIDQAIEIYNLKSKLKISELKSK